MGKYNKGNKSDDYSALKSFLSKLPLWIFVAVTISYMIAYIAHAITNDDDAITTLFNILPVMFIGGFLSLMIILSATNTWSKFLNMTKRIAPEAEGAANDFETMQEQEEKRKADRIEALRNKKLVFINKGGLKKFKAMLIPILICLLAGGGLLVFNSYLGGGVDGFEKTEAVLIEVVQVQSDGDTMYSPVYEYVVDGVSYQYKDSVRWNGVSFKEGSTITIYYDPLNPQIASTKSTNLLVLILGLFFLAIGIILLFSSLGIGQDVITPIIFGGIFAGFGGGIIYGFSIASGSTISQTLVAGPSMFFCGVFFLLGSMFICYGIFEAIRTMVLLLSPIQAKTPYEN